VKKKKSQQKTGAGETACGLHMKWKLIIGENTTELVGIDRLIVSVVCKRELLLLAVKIQKSSVLEKQNSIRRKLFAHKRIKEINIKWKKQIRFHCIIQIIWQINVKGHKVCNSTCNGIFDSYVRVRKKENKIYCVPELDSKINISNKNKL
jgi:hypothetical protein